MTSRLDRLERLQRRVSQPATPHAPQVPRVLRSGLGATTTDPAPTVAVTDPAIAAAARDAADAWRTVQTQRLTRDEQTTPCDHGHDDR